MSTVFVISSGCYSDYSVKRAFERREDAEEFIKRMGVDPGDHDPYLRVEELELHLTGYLPPVYVEHWARCWPNRSAEIEQGSHKTTVEPEHRASGRSDGPAPFLYATGPDSERVMKSVADRLYMWKAYQESAV